MNLVTDSRDERLAETFKRRAVDEDWAAELLDVVYDSLRAALKEVERLTLYGNKLSDEYRAMIAAKEKAEAALKASQDFFGAPEMVEELKRLREVLTTDHEALVNEDFDIGGWDNLTPGEKSMVRMTLAELRRKAREGKDE